MNSQQSPRFSPLLFYYQLQSHQKMWLLVFVVALFSRICRDPAAGPRLGDDSPSPAAVAAHRSFGFMHFSWKKIPLNWATNLFRLTLVMGTMYRRWWAAFHLWSFLTFPLILNMFIFHKHIIVIVAVVIIVITTNNDNNSNWYMLCKIMLCL